MRIELTIILIAGFIMANIYTDGKYARMLMSWKKILSDDWSSLWCLFCLFLNKKEPVTCERINYYIK